MKLLSALLPILAILVFQNLCLTSAEQFESDKWIDSGCLKDLAPAKNLDPNWISKIAAWFVPTASPYFYYKWGERLTNHSLPKERFDQLCMKWLFLASQKPKEPYLVLVGGLNKATMMKCTTKGPSEQECDGVVSAPDYKPGRDTRDIIAATDNKTYLLMVSCIRGKVKSWYVLTPDYRFPDRIRKGVVDVVKKLGFKKSPILMGYKNCPAGVLKPKAAVKQG